jgi:hypothetical protein
VAHNCNSNTLEAEVRGTISVRHLGYIVRPDLKNQERSQAQEAHACNPSYSGGRDQEDHHLKPAPGKWFVRHYLENTQHKTGFVEWLK